MVVCVCNYLKLRCDSRTRWPRMKTALNENSLLHGLDAVEGIKYKSR